MNNNQSLFYYGLWSNVVSIFGQFIVGVGVFMGVFGTWYIGVPVMLLGIFLFLNGRSKRFDYQMQSGTIIHRGDF